LDRLFALGEDMADGLSAHEAEVGVKQNQAADVRRDLTAARTAENQFQTKRRDKTAATTAQTVADSNGKALIATAKGVLENYLGKKWSPAWAAAGFGNNSTAIPATLEQRQSCLAALKTYFTANPAHQNAPLNVTPAQADARFTALKDARSAANAAANAAGAAKAARESAVAALRNRLTGLIGELDQLLEGDDPRWYAFGLSRPADPETPGVPDNLVLTAGPAGTVLADWADARRAARYRVFKQVVGTDPEFVPAVTVTDSDATLTGLPTGSTVNVRVSARQRGRRKPAQRRGADHRPMKPAQIAQTSIARIFHKLPAERRLGVGFAAGPRPKPVANRRSTLSAFRAACEISGIGAPACRQDRFPQARRAAQSGKKTGGSDRLFSSAFVRHQQTNPVCLCADAWQAAKPPVARSGPGGRSVISRTKTPKNHPCQAQPTGGTSHS
jgi:hypothetical protein